MCSLNRASARLTAPLSALSFTLSGWCTIATRLYADLISISDERLESLQDGGAASAAPDSAAAAAASSSPERRA